MVTLDRLLPFATTAFVLIVIPGPSVLFVISRALAHGRRAALATVLGNASGVYLPAVGVAIGIGALVQQSIAVFTVLRLAGALYLVFLGVQAIVNRRSMRAVGSMAADLPDRRRRFREGFIVGATNPKGFVLFSAILPQFVDRSAGYVPVQMLVFALVAMSIAVVTDSAWAVAAGSARDWFARSPRRGEALGVSGGAVMIGLGLQLAVTRQRD
jgi:threonine/homoserine/homoserine lactone efflux protein